MATVLLVDDDLMILELCKNVLICMGGLHVLPATCASQALEVSERHSGTIELLVSDIAMPGGINGIELADRLTRSHPETKVLLMSGLNPDPLAINASWEFLAKPFRPSDLTSRVNNALKSAIQPMNTQHRPAEGHRDGAAAPARPMPLAWPMRSPWQVITTK